MKILRVSSALLVVLWLAGCGGGNVAPCVEQDVRIEAHQALEEIEAAGDWKDQLGYVVANRPADSVITIVVFMHPQGKQEFFEWVDSAGVTVKYEFVGFSAVTIIARIEQLPSLKEVSRVTGIDWNITEIVPGDCLA